MKRPRSLTILMWFCALYAIGAAIGIIAVLLDLGRFFGGYTIGGMTVNRGTWLRIAAPLVAMVAFLMGATAFALKHGRPSARITSAPCRGRSHCGHSSRRNTCRRNLGVAIVQIQTESVLFR